MGNRRDGDVAALAWENLLDLSHSVYPGCCHFALHNHDGLIGHHQVQSGETTVIGASRSDWTGCGRLRKKQETVEPLKFSFRHSIHWSIFISIATLLLAIFFSVTSTVVLEGVAWGAGMLVVLVLVLIGVVFDMIGIASAAADEKPFHGMAAEKVAGAKHAIQVVRHADRVSSFCNDVIGDIVGVISGTATAVVVIKLVTAAGASSPVFHTVVSVVFSAVVSALMVGGKALGKSFSIHYANQIVFAIGKFFYVLERKLGIKVFRTNKTGKKSRRKKGSKRAARTDT